MTLKHEIKLNDKVVYISGTTIRKGIVIKINKSTYKVKGTDSLGTIENYKKEKVAHEDDILIAFWDCVKDKSHMGSNWNYTDHQHHAHKATDWTGIGYCVWVNPDMTTTKHIR